MIYAFLGVLWRLTTLQGEAGITWLDSFYLFRMMGGAEAPAKVAAPQAQVAAPAQMPSGEPMLPWEFAGQPPKPPFVSDTGGERCFQEMLAVSERLCFPRDAVTKGCEWSF